MAVSYDLWKKELQSDPLQIGYASLIDRKDIQGLEILINTATDTIQVPRGIISRSVFIADCVKLGVFERLMILVDVGKKSAWEYYLDKIMPLIDNFDVNGDTFTGMLQRMLADGLVDADGAHMLQYRAGTRAEALDEPGARLDAYDIAHILFPEV